MEKKYIVKKIVIVGKIYIVENNTDSGKKTVEKYIELVKKVKNIMKYIYRERERERERERKVEWQK